ncbi:MAG: HPr family phosphocarrier protein [Lachnospiraceae bacterium]
MKEFTYKITDPVGIHARPAGLLSKEAKKFSSKITIAKGDKSADMTKLLAMMGLGVKQNDTVTITVDGADEDAAAEAISKFMSENF